MKRIAAVLMLFFGSTAPAIAVERGYYVYADWMFFSFSDASVNSSDAIRLGGGYHFNPYVGLEAGVIFLSPFLSDSMPQFQISDNTTRSLGVTSGQVSVIGSLPLNQKHDLFAKLGWANTTLDFTYSSPGNVNGSGSASKSNPIFGFGWQYTPGPNSGFRVQYETFGKVKLTTNYSNPYSQSSSTSDIGIQAVSVGLVYRF